MGKIKKTLVKTVTTEQIESSKVASNIIEWMVLERPDESRDGLIEQSALLDEPLGIWHVRWAWLEEREWST